MPAEIARGLADLRVGALGAGAYAAPTTWVDVPGARSLAFNTESDSDELEGDNQIIAKVRNAPSLTGSMELGQINLAALAVLLGGSVATTGTGAAAVSALKQSASAVPSYYAIVGQAPGVDAAGSAYRVLIYKALTTSGLDETLEVNAWNTPSLDFEGMSVNGSLLVREQYVTEVALPPATVTP